MEYIQTAVEPVTVEIDGAEYAVAEKTIAVAEELLAAQRKAVGRPEYQLWIAELEILLGRAAVKKLFRAGKKENIDRLQQIHAGVCRAFERNADRIEQERAAQKAVALSEIADVLAPVNELLKQLARMEEREPKAIRRSDV